MRGPSEVLVVEDSPDSVALLASALSKTFPGSRITLAGSIREFEARFPAMFDVGLAVIDLGLPDGNGLTLIEAVHARFPDAQILVYTLFDDDGHLFEALRCGAQGYLLKFDPPARLGAALQAIMAGEPPLSPKIAARMLKEFRLQGRLPAATPGEETGRDAETARNEAEAEAREDSMLTPRELETLTLTAKGLRLPDLAAHLGVTRSTAATYLKRIYRKLSVNSRAEATIEAARLGLVKIGRGQGG